jgi:hypothetical protein
MLGVMSSADIRVTFRRQPSGNIERDVEDTIDQLEQTSTGSYRSPHSGGAG